MLTARVLTGLRLRPHRSVLVAASSAIRFSSFDTDVSSNEFDSSSSSSPPPPSGTNSSSRRPFPVRHSRLELPQVCVDDQKKQDLAQELFETPEGDLFANTLYEKLHTSTTGTKRKKKIKQMLTDEELRQFHWRSVWELVDPMVCQKVEYLLRGLSYSIPGTQWNRWLPHKPEEKQLEGKDCALNVALMVQIIERVGKEGNIYMKLREDRLSELSNKGLIDIVKGDTIFNTAKKGEKQLKRLEKIFAKLEAEVAAKNDQLEEEDTEQNDETLTPEEEKLRLEQIALLEEFDALLEPEQKDDIFEYPFTPEQEAIFNRFKSTLSPELADALQAQEFISTTVNETLRIIEHEEEAGANGFDPYWYKPLEGDGSPVIDEFYSLASPGPTTHMYDCLLDALACSVKVGGDQIEGLDLVIDAAAERLGQVLYRHLMDGSYENNVNAMTRPTIQTYNAAIRVASEIKGDNEMVRDKALSLAFLAFDELNLASNATSKMDNPILPNSATYTYLIKTIGNSFPPSKTRGNVVHGMFTHATLQGIIDRNMVEAYRVANIPSNGEAFDKIIDERLPTEWKDMPKRWTRYHRIRRLFPQDPDY